MAVKNKLKELKDKKKLRDDIVIKLKKEGKVTNPDLIMDRINDLTDLVLYLVEKIKEKYNG